MTTSARGYGWGKKKIDLKPVYMEWGTPVFWGWFLLFSRAGGHKTKETYPTRPVSPTACKQGLNFFFFLAASALVLALRSARSRALADVFEKNEKKNKTTTVYRLT